MRRVLSTEHRGVEQKLSAERVTYRAFVVNARGRLSGVPEIITAYDDGDAVFQAEQLRCPQPLEVWEGARLVALVPIGGRVRLDTGAES
jgi:hypothetical protein